MRVIKTNNICIKFRISEKIKAARIVAVKGCINNPIDPFDAETFPIPIVIKNCPPN
jgi:hypothetical protein